MKILKQKIDDLLLSIIQDTYINIAPFPHIVIKDIFSEDVLNSTIKGIKKFNNTKDKVWHKLCTKGNDFSAFGKKTEALMKYLISEEWVSIISNITGIEGLVADPQRQGAGINFEPRGAHLELHTDFNTTGRDYLGWRRINILLFLSKNWQDEWGGQNELWNEDLTECKVSWHGFPPVTCPKDRSRKVISCYYYHPTDKGPHSSRQNNTTYAGWGKDRDFEGRRGTGFKAI